MYKSIYEEALEKIDVEFDSWDRAEHLELLQLVEHALEKAQKQEKLLELYKNLHNLYKKLDNMELSLLSLNSNYYEIEITKIKYQIKELENNEN